MTARRNSLGATISKCCYLLHSLVCTIICRRCRKEKKTDESVEYFDVEAGNNEGGNAVKVVGEHDATTEEFFRQKTVDLNGPVHFDIQSSTKQSRVDHSKQGMIVNQKTNDLPTSLVSDADKAALGPTSSVVGSTNSNTISHVNTDHLQHNLPHKGMSTTTTTTKSFKNSNTDEDYDESDSESQCESDNAELLAQTIDLPKFSAPQITFTKPNESARKNVYSSHQGKPTLTLAADRLEQRRKKRKEVLDQLQAEKCKSQVNAVDFFSDMGMAQTTSTVKAAVRVKHSDLIHAGAGGFSHSNSMNSRFSEKAASSLGQASSESAHVAMTWGNDEDDNIELSDSE